MKFYGTGVLLYPGTSRAVHDFEDGPFETLNPEIIKHALAQGFATEPIEEPVFPVPQSVAQIEKPVAQIEKPAVQVSQGDDLEIETDPPISRKRRAKNKAAPDKEGTQV